MRMIRPISPCTGLLLVAASLLIPLAQADELVAADGRWVLPDPVEGGEEMVLPRADRNVTAVYLLDDKKRTPIVAGFAAEGGEIKLHPAEGVSGKVVVELAEKTTQFPDGRIVLSALDAEVKGGKAKLESHPGNHRIGFWADIADTVHWEYKATRPGMYDVEICYSLAGAGKSKVTVGFGEEVVGGEISPTGSWYRYRTALLGRVYISKAGKVLVEVRGQAKGGGALMNLKAITLLPAPEGKPVVQAADGVVELDARDATVHGTLLQYERSPKKLCLGYWAKPEDWASWEFLISKAGKFKVELTQGCGTSGGSEVELLVAGEAIAFKVEGTGGFQNWKARELGVVEFAKSGDYQLEVRPKDKKGVAVMDIRRVRLVPVE